MTESPQDKDIQPWYKQFWPWFLIALPGSVVIAGLITLWISIENSHQMVTGDYFKKGLAINETKERQHEAARLGLSFQLTLSNKQLTIDAPVGFDEPLLYLFVQHPARADRDFTLVLNKVAPNTYQVDAAQLASFNYRLKLWSPKDTWEIRQRWHPMQDPSVTLSAE
ncbi:FixH family protein [Pleionea litopenaei]|uniref:FixH family protein n=1 Tax=Pleionea litopenaei TaxID=3070815 RepID=A0AA51RTE8_9GAMM|nr:FixH family protein [Pleionea sp. HL-JVS1]WMS87149.1 FixH family protein [Pleionea sp. HL-JVS1]